MGSLLAGCTIRGGWPRFLRPGEAPGWQGVKADAKARVLSPESRVLSPEPRVPSPESRVQSRADGAERDWQLAIGNSQLAIKPDRIVSFGARPGGTANSFCAVEARSGEGSWGSVPGYRNCFGPMTGDFVVTNRGEALREYRLRWHPRIE